MVKAVASELQERIEQIRRQAFAAGYAEAMKAVRDLASRPPRNSTNAKPNGSRRVRATAAKTTRRSARPARAQRGTNALRVEEVLKAARPRAIRAADIRKALQKKRITISFPSLRGALRQLEVRQAARQVGDSGTWRYRTST